VSTLRLPDGREVRAARDPRTGLRVWARDGRKASRDELERAIEAATVRAMPIGEAERRGLREKGHRFFRAVPSIVTGLRGKATTQGEGR
jgi:hypothetical protein